MTARAISASRRIAAPAPHLFAIVAAPARHADFDGSGTVQRAQDDAPDRLELGTKFGMKMKFGIPYDMRSTVVEYEADRRIAWAHFGGHRWRYEFEPIDDATLVTETFDWSTAKSPLLIELLGWPRRHPANLARTLERLEAVALADLDV